jgi:hypothetical protein
MYGKTDYLIAVCKEANDNDDNDKARSWKCWNFELFEQQNGTKRANKTIKSSKMCHGRNQIKDYLYNK